MKIKEIKEDLRGDPAVGRVEAYHNTENDDEYKAFIAGVEAGNDAQYGDGGYTEDELPGMYKMWVEGGRKGMYEGIENKFGKGRQGLLTVYKLVKNDEITFGEFKNFIQAHRGTIY